jgi:hypothetical protein
MVGIVTIAVIENTQRSKNHESSERNPRVLSMPELQKQGQRNSRHRTFLFLLWLEGETMKCPKRGSEILPDEQDLVLSKVSEILVHCAYCGHESKLKDGEKR